MMPGVRFDQPESDSVCAWAGMWMVQGFIVLFEVANLVWSAVVVGSLVRGASGGDVGLREWAYVVASLILSTLYVMTLCCAGLWERCGPGEPTVCTQMCKQYRREEVVDRVRFEDHCIIDVLAWASSAVMVLAGGSVIGSSATVVTTYASLAPYLWLLVLLLETGMAAYSALAIVWSLARKSTDPTNLLASSAV